MSSPTAQSQHDSFSSLDDSLPCARPGVITEQISSSPIDLTVIQKKEVLQGSPVEYDNFRHIGKRVF